MPKNHSYDAVIVGSGPNGFAAAITLVQAGLSVVMFEAKETIGGGMRSEEVTLPGFVHDICSAIHPLGLASPFFKNLPLSQYGVEWILPSASLAHPFDDGSVLMLERSLEATAEKMGQDGRSYKQLMEPFVNNYEALLIDILAPLHLPHHPLVLGRFSLLGVQSANRLITRWFESDQVRSFYAGLAAHSIQPLERLLTASFGIVLGTLGHAVGWPLCKGGSQKLADGLAAYFLSLGGEIITHTKIERLQDLPSARAILLDVTPKQLVKIAGSALPSIYKQRLDRYRYGPGVFKIDWALSQPIPWKSKECLRAATVHLGGTFKEILLSESEIWKGRLSEKPFVLVAQQSLFDPSRAPEGRQTAWAYCHVPNGSTYDMTERIESQIERFAPGFKTCILARRTYSSTEMEQHNPNYVGGDINGGVQDIYQLFTRPVARLPPYATPVKGLYLCSSSTPPGGGVHGMCCYYAAQAALKQCFD